MHAAATLANSGADNVAAPRLSLDVSSHRASGALPASAPPAPSRRIRMEAGVLALPPIYPPTHPLDGPPAVQRAAWPLQRRLTLGDCHHPAPPPGLPRISPPPQALHPHPPSTPHLFSWTPSCRVAPAIHPFPATPCGGRPLDPRTSRAVRHGATTAGARGSTAAPAALCKGGRSDGG